MSRDYTCLLEADINTCPYYDIDTNMCRDEVRECGMFNKHYKKPVRKYVRKPRWYEKYYQKDGL